MIVHQLLDDEYFYKKCLRNMEETPKV
jgi:hypothetical protein